MNRLPKFVCRCHCRRSFYSNFRRGEKRRRRRTVPWGTDRSSFAYWPCVRRHIPIRHRRPIDLPTCSAVQRININILPLFFSFSFVPDSYLPICLACDLWRAEVSNIFKKKKKGQRVQVPPVGLYLKNENEEPAGAAGPIKVRYQWESIARGRHRFLPKPIQLWDVAAREAPLLLAGCNHLHNEVMKLVDSEWMNYPIREIDGIGRNHRIPSSFLRADNR